MTENKQCRDAFDAALKNFDIIHNNGRYWDTFELFKLWQIAYNYNEAPTGELPLCASIHLLNFTSSF